MLIDHIEPLELSDEIVSTEQNALRSLDYLAEGLFFLYSQVARIEQQVTSKLDPTKLVMIYGNYPALDGVPKGMVACAFHWYAVSVCNFARLVGWLGYERDAVKAREYVERILPEVKLWRDKIAAHFALADPQKQGARPDNEADLAASVLFPVEYYDGAFRTQSFTLSLAAGEGSHTSRRGMCWGLTATHRALYQRYWPEALRVEPPGEFGAKSL